MHPLLRRVLLGPYTIPQWVPIPGRDPQRETTVWLHGFGEPIDVTSNNVVAALKPLTIGICLENRHPFGAGRRARLRVHQAQVAQRALGTISLRSIDSIDLGGFRYWLFRTTGHRNYCVPRPRLWFHYWRHIRAMGRSREGFNFRLNRRELPRLFMFYCCPRPVVLVTVKWEDALNMFPMDLIGPTAAGVFSLALRSTSPAVELMKQSRRLVLSGAPFSATEQVYVLGRHHRVKSIDPNTLPFATTISPHFRLPIAAEAVRVREVEVQQVREVGSHHLFLTRVVHDEPRNQTDQLFHVSGFYQHHRERAGIAPRG